MTRTAFLLFVSSCSTAIIHALIPDHWLPFVLISRVERWSEERAATLAGLAGALHVLVSLLAGGVAILVGSTTVANLAARTGRSLEFLGGLLLVVFGAAYGIWRHRREARSHQGPDRPSADPQAHVHAHGHLLERWYHGALTARALVLVIGMSPCALLIPILLAAGTESLLAVLVSALGFALCTIATMVGITVFAMRGMRRIDLPFFAHYGDLISGALVSAIGVVMMLHDV